MTSPLVRLIIGCLFAGVSALADDDAKVMRVFIFAGQSNMVGSDSHVEDISNFPPFTGLGEPQPTVKFSYCLGRDEKSRSNGWVNLQPLNGIVGPELSFARKVQRHTDAPIAIIKCAAGGTHLGGDWNPDFPDGFKMYPLALDLVRSSLAELDAQKIPFRVEGIMWHQGENDMFEKDYLPNYGRNLKRFITRWRRDLELPDLRFYIGELCTKTIWGMDLRPRMFAISEGQKAVTSTDPFADYIPTSHVGVEIGGGVGLHYHYGTLGQLEHGENYGDAYLRTIGVQPMPNQSELHSWPYSKGGKVKLFILAGHRNMEGERAFIQDLEKLKGGKDYLSPNPDIAFKFSLGGGVHVSSGWQPLGPAGLYDTFGPELSFGRALQQADIGDVAIAKFTHSGSQIIDWTPEGSGATSRNLYPNFIAFIKESIKELEAKGQEVALAGIIYHLGENDMSFSPHRKNAPNWLKSIISKSRADLGLPDLMWIISQQPPTDHDSVNEIDVVSEIENLAALDVNCTHLKVFDLPAQEKQLVIDAAGVVHIGRRLAAVYRQK